MILKLNKQFEDGEFTELAYIENNILIGSCLLDYSNKVNADLFQLYVDIKFRNKGIATKLINECVEIAIKNNIHIISLIAIKDNEIAINLYKKLFFKIVYKYDNGNFLMVRDLKNNE